MKDYKLYLFDLDGTLAPFDSNVLYDDAKEWLLEHNNWAVVSNQGGVGLRHWMETTIFGTPENYPTEDDVYNRMYKLFEDFVDIDDRGWICFAYQSKSSGKWNPTPPHRLNDLRWSNTWRKPNPGMLLDAMDYFNSTPEETLVVGDSKEDFEAASNAGCDFEWAENFFERVECSI